jgi:hypothetical protein
MHSNRIARLSRLASGVAAGCVLLLASGVALSATTEQNRGVTEAGFLRDYSILRPGAEGEAAFRYLKPDAKFSAYDKVLIEPVTLWAASADSLKDVGEEDRSMILDYLHTALVKRLGEKMTVVDAAGPGVLRIRAAITEADKAPAVMSTVSTVMPMMWAASNLKKIAVGTQSFVGAAGAEVEITDSVTGELLGAAVDRRSGTKSLQRIGGGSWDDFRSACDIWAQMLANRLAAERAK